MSSWAARLSDAFVVIAAETLASGVPPRPDDDEERPVDRRWLPGCQPASTRPARFSARHPDMWFAFADVLPRKPPRRRPSALFWPGIVQSGLMHRSMMTTGNLEFTGIQAVELDPDVGEMSIRDLSAEMHSIKHHTPVSPDVIQSEP